MCITACCVCVAYVHVYAYAGTDAVYVKVALTFPHSTLFLPSSPPPSFLLPPLLSSLSSSPSPSSSSFPSLPPPPPPPSLSFLPSSSSSSSFPTGALVPSLMHCKLTAHCPHPISSPSFLLHPIFNVSLCSPPSLLHFPLFFLLPSPLSFSLSL